MVARSTNQAFAVCLSNESYAASLEVRKIYEVLSDPDAASHHLLRIVDESGEDYLYPEDMFAPIELPLVSSGGPQTRGLIRSRSLPGAAPLIPSVPPAQGSKPWATTRDPWRGQKQIFGPARGRGR